MNRLVKITLFLLVEIITVTTTVWCCHMRQEKRLTPYEKEAMAFLPGYSFLYMGERVVVKEAKTHRAFLSQHRAIPFLEDIIRSMKNRRWTKDRPPIEVTETEETIVVTIPRWPPKPEDKGFLYESEFLLQVTYDKKTGKRISAWSGL